MKNEQVRKTLIGVNKSAFFEIFKTFKKSTTCYQKKIFFKYLSLHCPTNPPLRPAQILLK